MITTLVEFNEVYRKFREELGKKGLFFEHKIYMAPRVWEEKVVIETALGFCAKRLELKGEALEKPMERNEKDHLASILVFCGLLSESLGEKREDEDNG